MLRMLLQTSVALHLFAAGAGVEGVGDEAGPQGVAGVVAGEAGDGCCSLDDLGGAVSSERFEAVKHTVEADEHRVVVGQVSMGARASRSAAGQPRRVRRWVESVGMLIVVMMFTPVVGLLAAACSQTRMLRNADLC
jgi:hypothetical protein